jgi:hypothetical protein
MNLGIIDDKQYDLDKLPQEAKSQIINIQFIDSEINRLEAQIAVFQTARIAYSKALKEALPIIGVDDLINLN